MKEKTTSKNCMYKSMTTSYLLQNTHCIVFKGASLKYLQENYSKRQNIQ
jgi:hypothetical protein